MPVSVAISFPSGRFHATPWGHHVNEALPEWPPSPWRFLRALVAVWKRKLPHDLRNDAVMAVFTELAGSLPAFQLPPATLGHTRHYMPTDDKPTKVFDAFVSLARDAEVILHWDDANLPAAGRQTLAALLSHLGAFGRAESWCTARLVDDGDELSINCTARAAGRAQEAVRVLAADPVSWNGWAYTDKKIVCPDPRWNLLAETSDMHLERWSDPPGSRWVNYARPADCFAPRSTVRPIMRGDEKTDYIAARFVLDVAEGRRPLPLVTETLPLAEAVRRELGRAYAGVIRRRGRGVKIERGDSRLYSPIIYGKDESGAPARSHEHAFYLPTDEDGDGRIDQVIVYAAGRFSRDDISALDRLRALSFGKEGEGRNDDAPGRITTHRLLLTGLDRAPVPGVGVTGPASVWVSATPYIAYRHMKRRGKKRDAQAILGSDAMPDFMTQILSEDFRQRNDLAHLPKPAIEFVADPLTALGWRYRSLQFRRARSRLRDDAYSRPCGAFRLTFPEPVLGPICLGYGCHFGMGIFRPATHPAGG